jgi:hypothetical protein
MVGYASLTHPTFCRSLVLPYALRFRHCEAIHFSASGAMDSFASLAMTMWREQARQIDPTGKSLPVFRDVRVQPILKKYSAFAVGQITATDSRILSRKEGRWPSSRTLGRAAVDATALRARRIAGRPSGCERLIRAGRAMLLRTAKPCGPGTRCWC